jgi:hypothetical protein
MIMKIALRLPIKLVHEKIGDKLAMLKSKLNAKEDVRRRLWQGGLTMLTYAHGNNK